jgi:hypothetical protein
MFWGAEKQKPARPAFGPRGFLFDDEPMPLICPTCQMSGQADGSTFPAKENGPGVIGGKPQSSQGRSSDLASYGSTRLELKTIFASPYTDLTEQNRKIEL